MTLRMETCAFPCEYSSSASQEKTGLWEYAGIQGHHTETPIIHSILISIECKMHRTTFFLFKPNQDGILSQNAPLTPLSILDPISNTPNERRRGRSNAPKSGLFLHPLLMTTNSQQCPNRRVNHDILDTHRVEVKKTQQKVEEDKALLMEKKSVKRESDAISDVLSLYHFQILERRGRDSCGE